jgi:hypothetical protein
MIVPRAALVIQCIRYIVLAKVSVSYIKSSHNENGHDEKLLSKAESAETWSYWDEDGIATRDSVKKFLNSTPRRLLLCLLGLGVAAAASQTVLDSEGLKNSITWVGSRELLISTRI